MHTFEEVIKALHDRSNSPITVLVGGLGIVGEIGGAGITGMEFRAMGSDASAATAIMAENASDKYSDPTQNHWRAFLSCCQSHGQPYQQCRGGGAVVADMGLQ